MKSLISKRALFETESTGEFSKGDSVQLGDGSKGTVVDKVEREGFAGYRVEITESEDEDQIGNVVGATAQGMKKAFQSLTQSLRAATLIVGDNVQNNLGTTGQVTNIEIDTIGNKVFTFLPNDGGMRLKATADKLIRIGLAVGTDIVIPKGTSFETEGVGSEYYDADIEGIVIEDLGEGLLVIETSDGNEILMTDYEVMPRAAYVRHRNAASKQSEHVPSLYPETCVYTKHARSDFGKKAQFEIGDKVEWDLGTVRGPITGTVTGYKYSEGLGEDIVLVEDDDYGEVQNLQAEWLTKVGAGARGYQGFSDSGMLQTTYPSFPLTSSLRKQGQSKLDEVVTALMNGQERISTTWGSKSDEGLKEMIVNNAPVEVTDSLLGYDESLDTGWGRKNRNGLEAMITSALTALMQTEPMEEWRASNRKIAQIVSDVDGQEVIEGDTVVLIRNVGTLSEGEQLDVIQVVTGGVGEPVLLVTPINWPAAPRTLMRGDVVRKVGSKKVGQRMYAFWSTLGPVHKYNLHVVNEDTDEIIDSGGGSTNEEALQWLKTNYPNVMDIRTNRTGKKVQDDNLKNRLNSFNYYLWESGNKVLHPGSFEEAWNAKDERIDKLTVMLNEAEAEHGPMIDEQGFMIYESSRKKKAQVSFNVGDEFEGGPPVFMEPRKLKVTNVEYGASGGGGDLVYMDVYDASGMMLTTDIQSTVMLDRMISDGGLRKIANRKVLGARELAEIVGEEVPEAL